MDLNPILFKRGENYSNLVELMVSKEEDLTTVERCVKAIPGSIAFLPGYAAVWQKNFDDEWI